MMVKPLPPGVSLRREVAERLSSFFVSAGDGRSISIQTDAALASSQGPHRESNEDRCASVRFQFGSARPDIRLAIMCDGMGGMAKGGEAASMAVASFIAMFATARFDCALDERLYQACQFANMAVFNSFRGEAGTTLTAIAIGLRSTHAVHVGDSRLYGIDESNNIHLVTQDDTVSGAVNAHLGQDDEDDLDNRLLQYVGIGSGIEPHSIALTDVGETNLWLLTSDGAHSVGKRVLAGVCRGSKSTYDLVRKLVYVSEAIDTQDNSSAVCIRAGREASTDGDRHEGLTLHVSASDRNLEIWVPESALALARLGNDIDDQRTQAFDDGKQVNKELPRAARTKPKIRLKKKTIPKKVLKKHTSEPDLPLDVLFSTESGDD